MTDQSSQMVILAQRVEHLERQNRRLSKLVVLGLLIAGCLAVMGASKKGHVVQGTEFLLRDNRGQRLASLKMGSSGPTLTLYDADGKVARALLGVLPSGPALGLYDSSGKNRISLGLSEKGANLTFADSDEKMRAELGVVDEGPNLQFFDREGKSVYKTR